MKFLKILSSKAIQAVCFLLTILGLCGTALFSAGIYYYNLGPLEAFANLPAVTGEDRAIVWFFGEHNSFVAFLILSILLFLSGLIFLLLSAGRGKDAMPKRDARFVFPFDVSLLLGICAVLMIGNIAFEQFYYSWMAYRYRTIVDDTAALLIFLAGAGSVCLAVFAELAAQLRCKTLLKNLLLYRISHWFIRVIRHMVTSIVQAVPLLWKLILVFLAFVIGNFILASIAFGGGSFGAFLLLCMFDIAALCLLIMFALQLKLLLKAGQALADGDLSYHVDTEKLMLDPRRHGENLNSIRDGMSKAVEARMKNERFKTELITNVSHDLKTPLTSIINYADLLDRENLENPKAREYVEILKRQSAKLKKLTEDLIEASKASSGVITVNRETIHVEELLQQSVAEYETRFAQAQITPVLRIQDSAATICADGRLLWRVFDNLLSNICKYAHPDTRAYFDVSHLAGVTLISFKNISSQQLNIDPAELTERFIRGDSSRHTEGSGLGLSIAQSLTELQGGRFSISIDGDLFKVNIEFADKTEPEPETKSTVSVAETVRRVNRLQPKTHS